MDDFRKTLYTVDERGHRLWVYPAVVRGYFYRARAVVAAILLAIYLLGPWISVGGKQAVLLSIAERKFTFFGTTLWATDTVVLALSLAFLALCLFFFSAVLGRVWCGWACPETVFLEFVFRPIEALIEGSPAKRKRLDQGPWTFEKLWKKGLKHSIFLIISWILANTALAYFVGRESLMVMVQHSPSANPTMFGVVVFLTAIMLFQFGWFREQFCTIACPYARFQSVLLDRSSLLVGYDKIRGEPRGKPGTEGVGDCIDCGLCVRVCPTGIDIRNGTQLECIHCAVCVDACDSIMEKAGKPKGLVRYDTESRFERHAERFLRPRIVVYALLLLVISTGIARTLLVRATTDMQLVRGARDLPYTVREDGKIANHLQAHIANKSTEAEQYSLHVASPDGIELTVPVDPFPVAAGQESMLPVFFSFDKKMLTGGKLKTTVEISNGKGLKLSQTLELLGPD